VQAKMTRRVDTATDKVVTQTFNYGTGIFKGRNLNPLKYFSVRRFTCIECITATHCDQKSREYDLVKVHQEEGEKMNP
jgi:hypothetical protein